MDQANVIGAGSEVHGSLEGSGDLAIEGRVEGTVTLRGKVEVAPHGELTADVEGERVEVLGTIRGRIQAHTQITVGAGAEVIGDLEAPTIQVDPEARFVGRITMPIELPRGLSRGGIQRGKP